MFVKILFTNDVVSHGKITAYLIMIEKKLKIDECVLPIKFFIYTYQRLCNLLTYRQIINNGLRVFGVKTDSLFVDASQEELNNIFKFSSDIGGLKIEENKDLPKKNN